MVTHPKNDPFSFLESQRHVELDSNLSQRNSRLQAAVKLGVTLRLEKTGWVVPRVSRDESSALVRSLIASGSKA